MTEITELEFWECVSMGIKNFGKVDDKMYRGGQPRDGEYYILRSLGVKTVIDLRDDPESYARDRVLSCGMRYVNLPMSASKRPGPEFPSVFFNEAVMDKSRQPVFVHCAGGRHRTGAMVAAYRVEFCGWSLKQAMKELRSYDFPWWRWIGHGKIKTWIEDYALRMQR